MTRLVYLAPVPWNSFAQRPHKFVECFHKQNSGQIMWIDPYPTRFPSISDFLRIKTPAMHSSSTIQPPPWLEVVRLFSLPIEPLPRAGLVNGFLWRPTINKIKNFIDGHKTVLAIGKPSSLALTLLERFSFSVSLYDSMDDFPSFYNGLSHFSMARRERQIVKKVDIVWASSMAINCRWSLYRNDVKLVRNGLDPSPLQLPVIPKGPSDRRIFGYVGTIASWFDWDWVVALAHARSSDVIRLIGPVFQVPPSALPTNVELLPPCAHETAIKAMRDFDVGLIPFQINKLTESVDPIKYYEYRALGLPVISTAFGEMNYRKEESGVFISANIEDIASLAAAAVHLGNGMDDVQSFIQDNSWEVRFDTTKLFL
ncbi:MAG: hypothetical protein RBR06_10785 [Desulfuromonadaceae bacterium]|nr:hypothetical protein [Desulfuromonadaceae bacterium]